MKQINTFAVIGLVGVAALSVSPWAAAQSSVNLYGSIDMGVGYYSSANGSIKRVDSGQDTPSRFGVRGTEDLGGGLKAVYQLESGMKVDNGTTTAGTFWSRESYVGISGSFGRLSLGRHWNPGDGLSWDIYKFNNFAAFIFPEFGNFDRLYNNSIRYTAPSMGGFNAELLYSLGESTVSNSDNSAVELGLSYQGGGFTGALVLNSTKNAAGTASDKLVNASVSYQVDAFKLRAGFLDSRPEGSGLGDAKLYLVGFDYMPAAKFSLGADFQRRSTEQAGMGTNIVRLMGSYYMSKRTSVYANLASLSNRGTDTQSFAGNVTPGGHQTGVNLGLRHAF